MGRERAPVRGAQGAHAPLLRLLILAGLVLAAASVVLGPRAVWRSLAGGPAIPAGEVLSLQAAPFGDAIRAGELEQPALDETSGLAASRRRPDLLWAVNDSGSPPRLYAVGIDGRDRGAVDLAGATNVDWEDLASFELDGRPHLLVADVGDNVARRASVTLYVLEEPPLEGDRFAGGSTAQVAWTIEIVYEDGPLDCEAVAVDPVGERVLLASKRTEPARLYEAPLRPSSGDAGRVTAVRVAEIPNVPRPTEADLEEDPRFGSFRSQITALDVSADGRELVAVTYKDAYRFVRGGGETWGQAVSGMPQLIPLPRMVQTEAGAYDRDGAALFVTTEQRPAPLFRLDRAVQGTTSVEDHAP